jgi:hypothetical protein
MSNTIEQLKTILDSSGTITNGKDEIYRTTPTEEKYSVKGFYDNNFWWGELVWNYLTNPSDWQEVKKDTPVYTAVWTNDIRFAPRMIVVDAREWDAMQKELETLRAKVGKPFCHSCGNETFIGMLYCENCHNEIIGMS